MGIEVKNVSKIIKKKTILENINIRFKEAEVNAIVGLNGAGKTTLLKIITGLAKPSDGEVKIENFYPRDTNARKYFSFLPEQVRLPENLTGLEVIKYLLNLSSKKFNENALKNWCNYLEFDYYDLKRKIKTYSKGMQQKVSLMSVFISDTPFFILDEPFSGLDPSVRKILKKILLKEKEKRGIILSSHMLLDIDEFTDKITVIHNKKVFFSGDIKNFKEKFNEVSLEEAFLKCINH